jgi:hypothetical protein
MPIEETVLLSSEDGYAPLAATFTRDERRITGHLAWSRTCRHALVSRGRSVETITRKPVPAAGAAAGVGAVALGAAGGGLLSHLDVYSDQESCSVDNDGDQQCSSPRGNATFVGVLLATTAVALAATSLATFASKRSTTTGDETLGPPGRPHVVENGVECGHGVPSDIGLSIYSGNERVLGAVSDENGDVRFILPEWLSGIVDVVVDTEPPGEPLVHKGDIVGRLQVPAPRVGTAAAF